MFLTGDVLTPDLKMFIDTKIAKMDSLLSSTRFTQPQRTKRDLDAKEKTSIIGKSFISNCIYKYCTYRLTKKDCLRAFVSLLSGSFGINPKNILENVPQLMLLQVLVKLSHVHVIEFRAMIFKHLFCKFFKL